MHNKKECAMNRPQGVKCPICEREYLIDLKGRVQGRIVRIWI